MDDEIGRRDAPDKVLVLGGSTRAFLAVVRSLGRKGLVVHAGSPSYDQEVLRSRYLAMVHYLPPLDEPDNWKDEVMRIMEAERFSLVIPTNDPAILLCQRYRAELERFGRIYLLNEKADLAVNDKMRTYELARKLGVNVPRSVLITPEDEPGSLLKEFDLPIMLKPVSSFSIEDLRSKRYVKRARNEEELSQMLTEMLASGPLMAQEYFEGVGVGVEVLCLNGRVLTQFQHLRVHEPRGGGASTYRRSMPVDPELLDASKKIMAMLDYTGVGMLEFKVDFRSERWTLIEINGRFWGSLPLPVAAGMDFPFYLYEMLVRGRTEFPQDFDDHIYCRNTSLDFKWMRENLMDHKGQVLREMSNFVLLRERNDTLVKDDPIPGVTEIANVMAAPIIVVQNKIRFKLNSLTLIRRRRAKRLATELANARSILFICMGNICRSPFAEHYGRKLLPSRIIMASGGTYEKQGRTTPDEGIAVSKSYGVDLLPHRSRTVTEGMMKDADVVFVFDGKNMSQMRERFPSHRKKLWYLAEADPTLPLIILDPYGKDLKDYETAYRMIAKCLDRMNSDAGR
jgi:protein-tyrosine-phosphatase/predicted ATP-grasp superfamily ATP-dependent carboligase